MAYNKHPCYYPYMSEYYTKLFYLWEDKENIKKYCLQNKLVS